MLEITGAAKSADEATRVMIYKNGKSSIYGKGQYKEMCIRDSSFTSKKSLQYAPFGAILGIYEITL